MIRQTTCRRLRTPRQPTVLDRAPAPTLDRCVLCVVWLGPWLHHQFPHTGAWVHHSLTVERRAWCRWQAGRHGTAATHLPPPRCDDCPRHAEGGPCPAHEHWSKRVLWLLDKRVLLRSPTGTPAVPEPLHAGRDEWTAAPATSYTQE